MELHIQKCQNCGSREMRNVLVRDEQQKVYVQCRQCAQLVARYLLSTNGGYYHEGKEFESFLRSMERGGEGSSGKDVQLLFDEAKTSSATEFSAIKQALVARYVDGVP